MWSKSAFFKEICVYNNHYNFRSQLIKVIILCLLDRASFYNLNKLNQLDVILWKFFYYFILLLNMFRMLLYSSSGAGDYM